MNITDFLKKSSVCLMLVLTASNTYGFGGDEVRRAKCDEPRFKNMKPAKLIAPGGEFSFTVSTNAVSESISATIKGYKADLTVENDYGYQVKGNMPSELTEGYALIKIKANSRPSSCIGEKAWLVKIVEQVEEPEP